MAAYNFQKRFVGPIRAGTKHHTIRADRVDGRVPKVGEPLALYCGMRTKQCFKILDENPLCTRVEPIRIEYGEALRFVIIVDGCILDRGERERLAQADGFKDFDKMMEFWRGRLPFEGNIIHWR